MCEELVDHSACCIFEVRFRAAELFEPRDCGVDVCLVEYLAATERVAISRKEHDLSPLGVEALARGPTPHVSDDCSEITQSRHGFDVEMDVLVEIPSGAEVFDHVTGRESCAPPMVFILEIPRRGGKFAPVNRGVRP